MTQGQKPRLQGPAGWEKFPLFWFLLFLSYRCTRRCPYCYTFNQVGDDDPAQMDARTFDRLLEWIPEVWRANNTDRNVVCFLGGEPLLRTDRIRQVMEAVTRGTKNMQAMVTTNADLVDTVNWDDLAHIQWMTVNITDIGIPELSRRMTVIRQHANVKNQTIAVTLDDANLERILEIARFGIENGYRLRCQKNLFKSGDLAYQKQVLAQYHRLCDLLETYAARGYNVHTTFLLDLLVPGWTADTSPYPCGKRIAAVFPDGTFGPCIRDHGFKTGTLFDPDPMDRLQCDRFHFDVSLPDISDDCRKCPSATACQGGCPRDKLLVTGSRSGKSVFCAVHREIIPRLQQLGQTGANGTAHHKS